MKLTIPVPGFLMRLLFPRLVERMEKQSSFLQSMGRDGVVSEEWKHPAAGNDLLIRVILDPRQKEQQK